MIKYLTTINYRTKQAVFIFLTALLDLSEYIYLKLNYIKSNYKSIFSDIFEEKDSSIHNKLPDQEQTNPYIKAIINWFASLFGSLEEEGGFVLSNNKGSFSIFYKEPNTMKHRVNLLRFMFVLLTSLVFLIYYYFT